MTFIMTSIIKLGYTSSTVVGLPSLDFKPRLPLVLIELQRLASNISSFKTSSSLTKSTENKIVHW